MPLAILLAVGLTGSYTSVTLDSACAPSALTSLALPTTACAAIEQATHASISHAPSLPHTATCTFPSRSTAPFRYIAALSMLHATSFRTPRSFRFASQLCPPFTRNAHRLAASVGNHGSQRTPHDRRFCAFTAAHLVKTSRCQNFSIRVGFRLQVTNYPVFQQALGHVL